MLLFAAAFVPALAPTADAASCKGKSHQPPVLSGGKANPGTGTPATTITFSVTYTDSAGCAPTSIEVIIQGGGRYAMSGPGSGFAGGVTFVVSRTLPAGNWDYDFTATSGTGGGEETVVLTAAAPSRVVITVPPPKPTPKPTPKATPPPPKPTPKPPPKPTPKPTAKPAPKPPVKATPKPKPPVKATPKPAPAAATPALTPAPSAPSASAAGPSPSPSAIVTGAIPPDHGGGSRPAGPGGGGAQGSGGWVFGPRPGHDSGPGTVAVGMVSAATSVLALGALGMAARRRRRRDLVLAVSSDAPAAAVAIASSAPAPPPAPDALPPWQTLTGRAPSKFASNPSSGIERLTISYRFVRLSDGPDDLRSREISRLDRGDEVEVIAEQDGMLQVRTASGLVGWVPRVTVIG